ncbi:hypothetical protein P43SY_003826 [Pythium insidiosum]|uniref:Uncharacterized protein n=1 Tax=Pythium insidiosum TaxID=114742 RepID=A0AAD5LRB2_PYTIN|nr:hypothetical protein P43SY_003826 [Pythium insidiosum]
MVFYDDDEVPESRPMFLFDWQLDNVQTFVAAANRVNATRLPSWLKRRPPDMTAHSFTEELFEAVATHARGRLGHVMLGPNTLQQLGAIMAALASLQADSFLQAAVTEAFPQTPCVEYLAVTYCFDTRGNRGEPMRFPTLYDRDGQPLRSLFM